MGGLMIRIWTIWALYLTFCCFGVKTNSLCPAETQYEHAGRCCNKCPPGKYMTKRCTFNADTVCNHCGPNEYRSVWNDELKCALHMVCDKGKALRVLHKGNRTHPQECVCIDGHHLNEDICMENKICPPGSGVQRPVQQNKNTVCEKCQEGYFSNTSSSTEPCRRWTNCSEFELQDILPGTNISDAVCNRLVNNHKVTQMIILITVLIVSLAVILFICVLCYMKKFSALKATVQEWMQETCVKLCGSEKQSQYREVNTKEHGYAVITNTTVVENMHSDNLKEVDIPRGRLVPMEDEYMEQRRSPELQNGSIVVGMESLSDLESGSLGTFHAYSDTSSDRLLCSIEEVIIPPCSEHHCSEQACKETPRKRREEHCIPDPMDNNCGQHSSRHEFHIHPQASYHIPEKEPCSCFTNAQYTRSSSSNSTDNASFPETPPTPSGNVTGNNNTTVISSAPVMNIKTDMVVVYYQGSSQDAHVPGESEENMKRPMQEERQDHCDSFVANTPPYKYNDIPCCSVPDTDSTETDDTQRDSSCGIMSTQDLCDIIYCHNTDFLPVQEEGKPEFYHLEVI